MAIGAVGVSFPFAFLGSWYLSLVNDLAAWQGLMAYSGLGSMMLLCMILSVAVEDASGRAYHTGTRRR